jgi:hypothetical protein
MYWELVFIDEDEAASLPFAVLQPAHRACAKQSLTLHVRMICRIRQAYRIGCRGQGFVTVLCGRRAASRAALTSDL